MGCMPRTPLEAYVFDARFGKRSVFILDPRLMPLEYFQSNKKATHCFVFCIKTYSSSLYLLFVFLYNLVRVIADIAVLKHRFLPSYSCAERAC